MNKIKYYFLLYKEHYSTTSVGIEKLKTSCSLRNTILYRNYCYLELGFSKLMYKRFDVDICLSEKYLRLSFPNKSCMTQSKIFLQSKVFA